MVKISRLGLQNRIGSIKITASLKKKKIIFRLRTELKSKKIRENMFINLDMHTKT